MGVMIHLQHAAPSASQIAIGLALVGLVAVIVDYARMLILRSKMVGSRTHYDRRVIAHTCPAAWSYAIADCW